MIRRRVGGRVVSRSYCPMCLVLAKAEHHIDVANSNDEYPASISIFYFWMMGADLGSEEGKEKRERRDDSPQERSIVRQG